MHSPFYQLSGIAEGLNYLHSCNVIHGDLKGVSGHPRPSTATLIPGQSNTLVDAAGRARVTDFGLSVVTRDLDPVRCDSSENDHGFRWTAPEIADGRGTCSMEADIFSFAGVTIEVRFRW